MVVVKTKTVPEHDEADHHRHHHNEGHFELECVFTFSPLKATQRFCGQHAKKSQEFTLFFVPNFIEQYASTLI